MKKRMERIELFGKTYVAEEHVISVMLEKLVEKLLEMHKQRSLLRGLGPEQIKVITDMLTEVSEWEYLGMMTKEAAKKYEPG